MFNYVNIIKRFICNNRYKAKIKQLCKINGTRKIRVLFYVCENSKWCYQSLYDLLASSKMFEPVIIVSVLKHVSDANNNAHNILAENYNFFKSKGMNVEYGYKDNRYINLKNFSPDIVFYEQPYGLPRTHNPYAVSTFALTCYCPYGLSYFNYKDSYKFKFHYCLFKNFIDSEVNIARFETNINGASKNCIATGYSKLDVYHDEIKLCPENYWKDPSKIKIIYAPHHSFEANTALLATFRQNGKFILQQAKNHPETTWIFKPHPRFKLALAKNTIMSETEIEDYYSEWKKIGNVYTKGDYLNIFRTSDMMITDCCSFLGEYLPTGKPLIRPVNPGCLSLNELGEKVLEGQYQVCDNKELENIFEQLIANNDFKKNIRMDSIKYVLKETKSSEIIVEYIKGYLGI